MGFTITDVLNLWNEIGVFSYVIPFLIIFAVVFAILQKTKILGEANETKGLQALIAVAAGLLALQMDIVSEFYAIIFPKFGVGLSIFLVLVIMLGFFFPNRDDDGKFKGPMAWIGWLVGIGVVIWAITGWDNWSTGYGFGGWLSEYFWSLIVLAVLIGIVALAIGKKEERSGGGKKPPAPGE